jgi:hypothetical protein
MARPTEITTVFAAAGIISSTIVNGQPLTSKVVPRWILGLDIGDALTHLSKKVAGVAQPINGWVLTTASWVPSKVKSQGGVPPTPRNFTPGFDDWQAAAGGGDRAEQIDYKIALTGALKIWQILEYRHGDDTNNSEIDAMTQRQQVIDKFSANPRLGLEWPDIEHDELKFTSLAVVPMGTTLLHIAQGNIPFNFTYVVKPT